MVRRAKKKAPPTSLVLLSIAPTYLRTWTKLLHSSLLTFLHNCTSFSLVSNTIKALVEQQTLACAWSNNTINPKLENSATYQIYKKPFFVITHHCPWIQPKELTNTWVAILCPSPSSKYSHPYKNYKLR